MIPRRPVRELDLTTRDIEVLETPASSICPRVIVVVTTQPGGHRLLRRCIASIEAQDLNESDLGVLLLSDDPDLHAPDPQSLGSLRGRSWWLRGNFGSPARARNAAIEFIETSIRFHGWIARLDHDDSFAAPDSLRAAIERGDESGADFVIGGNLVLDEHGEFLRENPASDWLFDPDAVLVRLQQMGEGTAANEIPSCNLLIRSGLGVRYPDTSSAEDHWLVASVLLLERGRAVVVKEPFYSRYSIGGAHTRKSRQRGAFTFSRRALHDAAVVWRSAFDEPSAILGFGQEGLIRRVGDEVVKDFYREILAPTQVEWLRGLPKRCERVVPIATFEFLDSERRYRARYPYEPTLPVEQPSPSRAEAFLLECLEHGVVCANVKRSNFRIRSDGSLVYIDIGNWMTPMNVSIFRDASARLFAFDVLGWSDGELARRRVKMASKPVWDRLPGFAAFYRRVVESRIEKQWAAVPRRESVRCPTPSKRSDVTWIIKACAMDARDLSTQVRHLVEQLVGPTEFTERWLALDSFPGPYLRAHDAGNFFELMRNAEELVRSGIVDRVLVSPSDENDCRAANARWFGIDCPATHSLEGVPIVPQTWAMDQVRTRYVFQCDVDVLVGRRDRSHDYIAEMISACEAPDVVGVAFDIPWNPEHEPRRYDAHPGEYKPEVRCGLIDLDRLRAILPLPNVLEAGSLTNPWYRALHVAQRSRGLRTLRGGSGRSFYIHPTNDLKRDRVAWDRVRDIVRQCRVPPSHWSRWEVGTEGSLWKYEMRSEQVIVVARGRNVPAAKLERFARGIAIQDHTEFGLVIVDDGSEWPLDRVLCSHLQPRESRITWVRRSERRGAMENLVRILRDICTEMDSLIVIVDLDDALADAQVIGRLEKLAARGHDVILAAPYRPDDPTKVYEPDFESPRRKWGGDVWIHLRAFRRGLFESLRDEDLQVDGTWVSVCEDFATMIPMVEAARSPVYVPEYWIWHERSSDYSIEESRRREATIRSLLAKR